MNRRQFLWLAGSAACGGTTKRVHRRLPPPKHHYTGLGLPDPTLGGDDWSAAKSTQLLASRLLSHGDRLLLITDSELSFINELSLARFDGISGHYRSVCVLQDGTLAAFDDSCTLDLIDTKLIALPVRFRPCGPDVGFRVIRGSTPSELYISHDRNVLERVRARNGEIENLGPLEFGTISDYELAQSLGLGDGRVLMISGTKFLVGQSDRATVTYATPGHHPGHLAIGAAGAIWYSSWNERVVVEIVLARLGTELEIKKVLNVSPGRITHMASGETGALAAVINTPGADDRFHWEILLLDETGSQRWRVPVPDEIVRKVSYDLNVGFVAVTTHRVVLYVERFGLYAWDVATGAFSTSLDMAPPPVQ